MEKGREGEREGGREVANLLQWRWGSGGMGCRLSAVNRNTEERQENKLTVLHHTHTHTL